MSAAWQTAIWGLAACTPLALNFLRRRDPDARGLAAMIVLIWGWGRLMHAIYTVPECMALNPLVDAIAGATAFTAYISRPQVWKLILTGLYLIQVMLALSFWLAWPAEGSLYSYIYWNNWAFAGQLLCVASPGGFLATRAVLRRLLDRPRPLHLSRARR